MKRKAEKEKLKKAKKEKLRKAKKEKLRKKSCDSDDYARGGNGCLHIAGVHKLRCRLALLDYGLLQQLIHLLNRCGHSQVQGRLARVVH